VVPDALCVVPAITPIGRNEGMTATQQVGTAVGAHLVGGLDAPDGERAMRTACRILGRHLHAVTDGETGERNQWIGWQLGKLTAIDGIDISGTRHQPVENPDYDNMPSLAIDPAVTALPGRSLGYADAVEQGYPIYRRLREAGDVPDDVKFQVSVPTPYASVVAWVRDDDQERFFPIYARAMADELAAIAEIVDHEDLVVQQDVAVEIGVLAGAFSAAGELGEPRFIRQSVADALATPVGEFERGVHLCYGDYKHRHFAVPEDLSLCVDVARTVVDRADFIHMPADRETGLNPEYYAPVRDLEPRRLALGVVDYEGDAERTRQLVEAATAGTGGMEFAVATECGMARISERGPGGPSLARLLELPTNVSAPIR
jgi:hypothetical protein